MFLKKNLVCSETLLLVNWSLFLLIELEVRWNQQLQGLFAIFMSKHKKLCLHTKDQIVHRDLLGTRVDIGRCKGLGNASWVPAHFQSWDSRLETFLQLFKEKNKYFNFSKLLWTSTVYKPGMAPVEQHLVLTEMVDRWLLSVYADGAHLCCAGLIMSWCIFCALAPPPRHVLLNTRSCHVSSAPESARQQ